MRWPDEKIPKGESLRHLGITVLLASLTMVGPLGIDAYLPSFMAIGKEFSIDPLVVQQTLSVYVVFFAAMTLLYGTLSDSFGRRPVILVGLAIFFLGSVAAALATSPGGLIVARALQGSAAGAGAVVARAVVQDRFPPAEAHRVMAYMTVVFGVAPAVAPVIGGWLQVFFGWRSVFVFLALASLAMMTASYAFLSESLPVARRQPFRFTLIMANYRKVLSDRRFLVLVLTLSLAFTGVSLYVGSAASFVMNILGQSETAFAWMFVPMIGGMMIGSALAPRLLARTSTGASVAFGFTVMLTAVSLHLIYSLLFTPTVPWAVVPLAFYSFGLSFVAPAVTVRALSLFPEMRGMASSVQTFVQMMTFAMVSGLVAPFLFHRADFLAAGHLVGILLAGALWWFAGRHVVIPARSDISSGGIEVEASR